MLLEPAELTDNLAHLAGDRATHIREVLRPGPSQAIRIGIANGPRGIGYVTEDDGETLTLSCELEDVIPARPPIDLLLALPRPKVLKRLWAQVAALGVGRILISNAAKVERYYFDAHAIRPEVYEARLYEGLMQAKDTRIPQVEVHRYFRILVEDHLKRLGPYAHILVAAPRFTCPIPSPLKLAKDERVLVAIGPEGGWTDFELDLLQTAGAKGVGLGPRILRSDTATIATLALVHRALQD